MDNDTHKGWRKSSYSNSTGGCVEIAAAPRTVGVRDTKQHGAGPVLEFSTAAWRAFLGQIKAGRFDL
jgi:uncharacterized protein DUF397